MRKRVIAVMMAAMMAMTMAACGDKENTPADGTVSGDSTGSVSTEESSGESDASEDSSKDNASDKQESQNEESQSEESTNDEPNTEAGAAVEGTEENIAESNETAAFDWDSVDWEAVCLTTTTDKHMKTIALLNCAIVAKLENLSQEEVIDKYFERSVPETGTATYDDITEEGKVIFDELFKLSMEELRQIEADVYELE